MDWSSVKALTGNERYIIGEKNFLHFAVLMATAELDGGFSLILEKRAAGIRQAGEISFPGGAVEACDKDPRAAAIRETVEELGIGAEDIEIAGKYGAQLTPFGSVIHCYLGRLKIGDPAQFSPQKSEVERILAIPLDFFLRTPPRREKIKTQNLPSAYMMGSNIPEHYHRPWGGFARDVFFWEYEGEVVWGLTAGMIYDLCERLKAGGEAKIT